MLLCRRLKFLKLITKEVVDIEVGDRIVQNTSITQDNCDSFKTIYGVQTQPEGPVSQLLAGSLFSRAIGNNVPQAIYISQRIEFLKPDIYVNEPVTVDIEVKQMKRERKRVSLNTRVFGQDGKIRIDGEAEIMVANLPIK